MTTSAARGVRALVLILVGLTVTVGSAMSDAYLHRGAGDDSAILVRQLTGRALATNADLRTLDASARERALTLLSEAGYVYVRQEISWAQNQPAPGTFDWTTTREIFASILGKNLVPVIVLVDTPEWARAPDDIDRADAPPVAPELFQLFCAELRAQFPDLKIFQIMRNLDDPEYWGGESFSPIAYQLILQAAVIGLDAAATDSLIVAGEVGANPALQRTGSDIELLEEMAMNSGIRALVDAFAVSVDGGSSSPFDRRASVGSRNLSRAVLIREALVLAGADDVPVWFTHFGWTGDRDNQISPESQGRFVESGIRRARNEWAWAGLIFNWQMTGDNEDGQGDLALFRDGQSTPLLTTMANYSRSSHGRSITAGFVPPDAAACTYSGNWQDQFLAGALYRTVRDPNASVTCRFFGTGISTLFRYSPDSGTAAYVVDDVTSEDGETVSGSVFLTFRLDDAFEAPVELASGLPEGEHSVTITFQGTGELVVGGFIVRSERPLIWPIAVLVSAGLVALFLGLRSLAYLAGEHVGVIDSRPDSPERTPLPVMPDWRPDPRFRR